MAENVEIVEELARRGFAVDQILHDVVIPNMSSAAVSPYLMYLFVPDAHRSGLPAEMVDFAESGWERLTASNPGLKSLLDAAAAGDVESRRALLAHIMEDVREQIHSWFLSLERAELLKGRTPNVDEYLSMDRATEPIESDATWIFDRFTKTYLDSWKYDSLLRELRFLDGKHAGPCSSAQMHFRRLDYGKVAVEIARRVVSEQTIDRGSFPIASKYVTLTLELLKRGERAAAAAIYDGVCQASPRSADAFNNRGFCILPDFPESALQDFERASSLGMSRAVTTVGNQLLAMLQTNRLASALELAERVWMDLREMGTISMWDPTTDEPTIIEVPSGRSYIASLATLIAQRAGDEVSGQRWRQRLDLASRVYESASDETAEE
ncbi:MAG: hypothetical protein ACYDEY_12790 [Acidimicrobiales bacterium]